MEDKLFSTLSDEEQIKVIKKVLNEMPSYYWDRKDEKNETYTHYSYLDSNDYLEESTVAKIVNKLKPALNECESVLIDRCIFDWWEKAIDDDWSDLMNEVVDALIDKEGFDEDDIEDCKYDEIDEILHNHVDIDPPVAELMLRSNVRTVVALSNGNTAFEELDTYIEPEDDIIEKYKGTSLEWLVKQQGYTMEQFKEAWETEESNSPFLKSLVQEIKEVWDWGGLELTFLTKISVKELFHDIYSTAKNRKITKQLTISKDAMCGLLDGWGNGVCGYFIELEKDVVIPANMLDITAVFPDAAYRYGPDDICGFTNQAWKGKLKID